MGKGTGKWELWGEFYLSDGIYSSQLISTATSREALIVRQWEEDRDCMYLYTTLVEEGTYEEDE
jgi:hypothetical protein